MMKPNETSPSVFIMFSSHFRTGHDQHTPRPRPRPRQVDHPSHPAHRLPRRSRTFVLRIRESCVTKGIKNWRKPTGKMIKSHQRLGKYQRLVDYRYDFEFLTCIDLERYTNCTSISVLGNARCAVQSTCGLLPVHQPATIPQSHLQEPPSHPQIAGFYLTCGAILFGSTVCYGNCQKLCSSIMCRPFKKW